MSIAVSTSGSSSIRAKVLRVVAASLVLTAGIATAAFFFSGEPADENLVKLSGRIEGDESAVSPKVGGRVREITVREGDQVKAGQVIATLDDEQIRAREDDARFAVDQAEAQVVRARRQITVIEAELQQSRLGTGQSRVDAEGRVAQAVAQEAAAEAELARAEATSRQSRSDADRLSKLAEMGVLSVQEAEQARSKATADEAAVHAARRQVEAAHGALAATKASLDNPAIQEAGTLSIARQLDKALAEVEAAEADADRARAKLKEAEANRADLRVVAPFDGTVVTRATEPGEVVTAGTPIVTIVDLSAIYLRGFVPEGEIGRVRVGHEARVYIDSAPDTPIQAVVERVDPQASFTPENTYFQDDRVKQVVGVKLKLVVAEGYAKPGMPAEGEIVVGGSTAGDQRASAK